MADKYAPIVWRSLREQGFQTRYDPTAKYATTDEPGRADGLVAHNGKSACVEVKCGDESFDFRDYRDNQREWAELYCVNEPYNIPLYVALVMGSDRPNYKFERGYHPRKLWMIPYEQFLIYEKVVLQIGE